MERKFNIGDHVCVNAHLYSSEWVDLCGKVGTVVDKTPTLYGVKLAGFNSKKDVRGLFWFDRRDLIPQEEMEKLDNEEKVLVGDLKNGYSFVRGEKLEELRMKTEMEREKASELAKAADKMLKNSMCGAYISLRRRDIEITKVIFNNPATIVFWSDGKKTVVKCAGDEAFDEEKGLAMAISKRVLGNQGNYYNEFRKWLPEIEVCEDRMPFEDYAEAFDRFGKAIRKFKGDEK